MLIIDNTEDILRNYLVRYFDLKEEYIGSPKIHLCGHAIKVQLENDVK